MRAHSTRARAARVCAAAAQVIVLCAAVPAPAAGQLRADVVASGLAQPVAFVQDPSDVTVQLIVQQNGRVAVLKSGVRQPADYLDVSADVRNSGEQGLLGLAFAPDYATSGRLFVNFVNLSGHTVIARFVRSASNPLRADPASRSDLRWPDGQRFITQPFANHKGGHLAFGPDGYLYIGMGDGGSGGDPFHLAQGPQSLLGKMLRIDVNVAASDPEGYDIPPTNPFAGQSSVLPEIWSFGLRNPWRWSFDNPRRGGTGALVIADVGQNAWEEINYQPAGRGGRNYGWRNREGAHDFATSLPPFSQPLTEPIFEYSHAVGRSITGGFVYRGAALALRYRGRYFFADFAASRVWSLKLTVNATTGEATASDLQEHTAELGAAAAANPAAFGEDADGELYVVSYAGAVYRLRSQAASATPGRRIPANATPVGTAVPRGGGGSPVLSAANAVASVAVVASITAVVSLPMPAESGDGDEACAREPRRTPHLPCAVEGAIIDALARLLPEQPDLARALGEAILRIGGVLRGSRPDG